MKAFIKTLDEKAWKLVFTDWKHSTAKDDAGNVVLTLEVKCSADDDRLANYNSKTLNATSNGIGADQNELITTCESAK